MSKSTQIQRVPLLPQGQGRGKGFYVGFAQQMLDFLSQSQYIQPSESGIFTKGGSL